MLLGAAAFTGQTRLDNLVFILSLRRPSHAPLIVHVKRFSCLVKLMQSDPRELVYRRLVSSNLQHVEISADPLVK